VDFILKAFTGLCSLHNLNRSYFLGGSWLQSTLISWRMNLANGIMLWFVEATSKAIRRCQRRRMHAPRPLPTWFVICQP